MKISLQTPDNPQRIANALSIAVACWLKLNGYDEGQSISRSAFIDLFVHLRLGSKDREALAVVANERSVPESIPVDAIVDPLSDFMAFANMKGLAVDWTEIPVHLLKWYKAVRTKLYAVSPELRGFDLANLAAGGSECERLFRQAPYAHLP